MTQHHQNMHNPLQTDHLPKRNWLYDQIHCQYQFHKKMQDHLTVFSSNSCIVVVHHWILNTEGKTERRDGRSCFRGIFYNRSLAARRDGTQSRARARRGTLPEPSCKAEEETEFFSVPSDGFDSTRQESGSVSHGLRQTIFFPYLLCHPSLL